MRDHFFEFFNLYEEGKIDEAFRVIAPHPNILYDFLFSTHEIFPFLVNYVDAAIFQSLSDARVALHGLIVFLDQEIKVKKTYPKSYDRLFNERLRLDEIVEKDLDQTTVLEGWVKFKQAKKDLAELYFPKDFNILIPGHFHSYDIPLNPSSFHQRGLVFLEPIIGGYKNQLPKVPSIFVFETTTAFFQLLQFDEVAEALSDPKNGVYILDVYPKGQISGQDDIHPFLTFDRPDVIEVLPLILEAIKDPGDWLYQIGKRLVYKIEAKRLGRQRSAAFFQVMGHKEWFDSHKSFVKKELGPKPPKYFAEYFTIRAPLYNKHTNKLKIAHIVPQLVDGGHAPTRLLNNLIRYRDREKFDLTVISTELLELHLMEYPFDFNNSTSSLQRGAKTLAYLNKENVRFYVFDPKYTYAKAAGYVIQLVQDFDIAIFHGPDVINLISANELRQTIRIFFEHGSLPEDPGFDLAIASIERETTLDSIGTKVVVLPFALDPRKNWKETLITKEDLGLPPNSKVMTTISNHLDERLSDEMCEVIKQVLKRVPNAYYAPIGRIENKAKFLHLFGNRIKFLGPQKTPSQVARSLDIYLNEFPFGSCLGMLDAMAAGLPVVTCYDKEGPAQAQYGGQYFGRVAKDPLDYINIAATLLQDPKKYEEWSNYSKAQFEKHSDVKAYVKKFEDILVQSTLQF